MVRSLVGAVVVVTGGSSGIGLATATAFGRAGAHLVLGSRDPDRFAEAAGRVAEVGAQVLPVPTDVTDAAQVEHLAETAVARFGRIDVWVNDAGTSLWGPSRRSRSTRTPGCWRSTSWARCTGAPPSPGCSRPAARR